MKPKQTSIIGDILTENYAFAAVFEKHGIDFCCNGQRTIEQACADANIDVEALISELAGQQTQTDDLAHPTSMPIDELSEYIYRKHHRYVEERIPEIKDKLTKIVRVHGATYPELIEIQRLFALSAGELTLHMKKEELILFPYFKRLVMANNRSELANPRFDSVASPIRMMHTEHDNEGERFRKISELSNNYTPPADACTTFRVTYALLEEFEKDLHQHIHLENNVLFKKGLEQEAAIQ